MSRSTLGLESVSAPVCSSKAAEKQQYHISKSAVKVFASTPVCVHVRARSRVRERSEWVRGRERRVRGGERERGRERGREGGRDRIYIHTHTQLERGWEGGRIFKADRHTEKPWSYTLGAADTIQRSKVSLYSSRTHSTYIYPSVFLSETLPHLLQLESEIRK